MQHINWLFTVIILCLVLPASAVEQDINLSGTWTLDREESDINSASALMDRQDFAGFAPEKDAGIPGRKGSSGTMPGDRPGGIGIPGEPPGGSGAPRKVPEGNFPGKSNWENLELTLIISQSQEELKITHRYSYENEDKHIIQTFSLKGGQDSNVMRSGRGRFYSETTLEKGKIINRGMHTVSAPTGDHSTTLEEEYSVSENGEVLILKAKRLTDNGLMTARMVFRRKTEP